MSPSTERMRETRERDMLAEEDAGEVWAGKTGEEREQAIRDHYGYNVSEKRAQAERDAAAERMPSMIE